MGKMIGRGNLPFPLFLQGEIWIHSPIMNNETVLGSGVRAGVGDARRDELKERLLAASREARALSPKAAWPGTLYQHKEAKSLAV